MPSYPLEVPALRVIQPLGVFYVTLLPARVLLEVAFSDVLSAFIRADSDREPSYALDGTQRSLQPERLKAISEYINRPDSAFPNSIILAANYRKADGLIQDAEDDGKSDKRWTVSEKAEGRCTLTIPTPEKLAAIIDGQHRLFAFAGADKERLDMHLICSIFLDLPKPFQAHLFATINSTQKRVDKSLTYELFGYNVEEEDDTYWSPDKLAVFLTRRLAIDDKSPLKGKIVIAPQKDDILAKLSTNSWKVSTAVIVEGIMRLYSGNPKKDTALLLDGERKSRKVLGALRQDSSPLRDAYTSGQDAVIYTMVRNFLVACDEVFWKKASPSSFITKTVGIQALFDILRQVAEISYESRDLRTEHFAQILSPAGDIDFSSDQFRNASGSGRSTIRRAIEGRI